MHLADYSASRLCPCRRESAAFGDPQPEFGLCRVLEALLEGRYPEQHFEVINTAMTAGIREVSGDGQVDEE